MRGANITTRIPVKIADKIRVDARHKGISVSGCIMRILERYYEDKEQADDDDVVLTRAEIQRRLENADNPRNCIAHGTIDEFLKHFDELTTATR
jgi:hypothetical protein